MGVGWGSRARRVIDFQGDQRLAGDIGNRRPEVLGDSFRLAVTGRDRAAIEMARAKQVAAMMVGIFIGFFLLSLGWSSFLIISSRPCRPADYR